MGAWGPGIFSDDDACDIRDDVRDLLADGVDPEEIELRILAEYAPPGTDPYRIAVARLALALRLHRYGRLDAPIRGRAIAAIEDGSAMGEWIDHRDEARRRAALDKARAQLESSQPPPKPVKKPLVRVCPWAEGDVFTYDLASGLKLVFAVRAVHRDKGGSYPTVVPIWTGPDVPECEALLDAPVLSVRREWVATFNKKITPEDPYWPFFSDICLLAIPNKTPERFRWLPCHRRMEKRLSSGHAVLYRDFDSHLEKVFGLR